MPRLAAPPALLGAILAVCVAAPVGAAEAVVAAAQQWDPLPWAVGASCLLIASLAAADAKADRRGH